MEDVSDMRDNC